MTASRRMHHSLLEWLCSLPLLQHLLPLVSLAYFARIIFLRGDILLSCVIVVLGLLVIWSVPSLLRACWQSPVFDDQELLKGEKVILVQQCDFLVPTRPRSPLVTLTRFFATLLVLIVDPILGARIVFATIVPGTPSSSTFIPGIMYITNYRLILSSYRGCAISCTVSVLLPTLLDWDLSSVAGGLFYSLKVRTPSRSEFAVFRSIDSMIDQLASSRGADLSSDPDFVYQLYLESIDPTAEYARSAFLAITAANAPTFRTPVPRSPHDWRLRDIRLNCSDIASSMVGPETTPI